MSSLSAQASAVAGESAGHRERLAQPRGDDDGALDQRDDRGRSTPSERVAHGPLDRRERPVQVDLDHLLDGRVRGYALTLADDDQGTAAERFHGAEHVALKSDQEPGGTRVPRHRR